MALFMTLLVRDEEDVVDAHLRYHLEAGVDHVIVTDNRSVDGTPEIIRSYERQGVVTALRQDADTHDQGRWVTEMALLAHEAGARWVAHSDADEFWMAPDGEQLGTWFRRLRWPNVVLADRHDMVGVDGDDGPFWRRMTYRRTRSTNSMGVRLHPKVAHRARRRAVVDDGNHDVRGLRWRRTRSSGLEILHFPLRSAAQFERKIRSGGQALRNNPDLDGSVGETWRRQLDELEATGRLSYVEDHTFDAEAVARALADGSLVPDTRLRDALEAAAGG